MFDVPDDKVEVIESTWINSNNGIVLEKLTEIPELEPEMDELNGGGGRGGGFRFGSFRGRSGSGARRGFGNGNQKGGRGSRGGGSGRGRDFANGRSGFNRERPPLPGGTKRRQSSESVIQRPPKVRKLD